MQYMRFGALVRVVRGRLGLRQADVAARARVSQATISRIERGTCGSLSGDTLDAVADALGIRLRLESSWQGARGDALLDSVHTGLVERVTSDLTSAGWDVRVEYSFNHYGDSGRVDVLGWTAASRALLVVEVKSEIADIQETLGRLDVKARVVPGRTRVDFGW